MKRIFLLLMMMVAMQSFAQDLTFSQFYEKPLLRNPALAGVFDGDIRVSGIFRNQWQSVTVPFQTGGASVEYKMKLNPDADHWFTLGMQVTHDVAGDIKLKRTQLLPVVNYHRLIDGGNDGYLSAAFMCGFVNSQFDPTQLKLNDQFTNGSFNPNNPTQQVFDRTGFSYFDMSTGLSYNSGFGENSRYYVGAGLFHVNKPKMNFLSSNNDRDSLNKMNRKIVFNAGLNAAMSETNRLIAFADYYVQGGNKQFLGGVMYGTDLVTHYDDDLKTSIYFGAFYRWNDAFVPVIKMDINHFNIGLSYDVNVSKLTTASNWNGGLELSLSYTAKLRNRNYDASLVRCPRF